MEIGELIQMIGGYGMSTVVMGVFLYLYIEQNKKIVNTLAALTETCATIKDLLNRQAPSMTDDGK